MSVPDLTGLRFGPLWFTPGYRPGHIRAVIFAGFSTISLMTFMGFAQPYILTEMLHIPEARQGTLTGNLAAFQEILIILTMGFLGAWSDRVGRALVFGLGFALLGLGYVIYPLATSEPQLYAFRLVFALGGYQSSGYSHTTAGGDMEYLRTIINQLFICHNLDCTNGRSITDLQE